MCFSFLLGEFLPLLNFKWFVPTPIVIFFFLLLLKKLGVLLILYVVLLLALDKVI